MENNGSIDEAELKAAVDCLKTDQRGELLQYVFLLKGRSYEEEAIESTFKSALLGGLPHHVLNRHAELLATKPYSEEIWKGALFRLADTAPHAVFENYSRIEGKDYEREVLKKVAAQSPGDYFAIYEQLKVNPVYIAVLDECVESALVDAPGELLRYNHTLNSNPNKDAIITRAFNSAKNMDPGAVLDNNALLKNNPDKENILDQAFRNVRSHYAFAEALANIHLLKGKPYEEEVLNSMCDNYMGASLLGQRFNALHDLPNAQRFALLKHLNAASEFDLITYGRSEVFTSTYLGVLHDLLDNLKQEGKNLLQVLSDAQKNRMDIFLEAAASYGCMNKVLAVIPPAELPGIVRMIADNAATDPSATSTLSNIMLELKDSPMLSRMLAGEVMQHYENAKTPQEKDRFGLLAAAYAANRPEAIQSLESPAEKAFFLGIANNPRYKQDPMKTLERANLVDRNGVCNQLMVFPGAQYEETKRYWMTRYAASDGWKIEEKDNYTHIYSTKHGKAGVPVHIYATNPTDYEASLVAINKDLAKAQGNAEGVAEFQIVVGRGHSFDADKPLAQITPSAHLVYLGSCGGYHNIQTILNKSPNAQVIATQQTGKAAVNNPMLFGITESIRNAGVVRWDAIQKSLDDSPHEEKKAYQLPHKNINLIMQRKYNELHPPTEANDQQPNTTPTTPATPERGTHSEGAATQQQGMASIVSLPLNTDHAAFFTPNLTAATVKKSANASIG